MNTFVTLSPINSVGNWIRDITHKCTIEKILKSLNSKITTQEELISIVDGNWIENEPYRKELEPILIKICANLIADPSNKVASFHLKNGASVERINFMGNTNLHKIKSSCSLMVSMKKIVIALK